MISSKRRNPVQIKSAEREYVRALRKIAQHVGDIISGFPHPEESAKLDEMLRKYSEILDQWARSTAGRMLSSVERRDLNAWRAMSKEMSLALRREIENTPTGRVVQTLMAEQVHLIKSIPLEAAQRVHRLVIEGQNSMRAGEIAKEILKSGHVAKSRAELIALTETSRAASVLTQARAQHIGSEGYVWRTSKDSHVRDSHKHMEGRFVRWDSPPTLDNLTGHAGCLPRCRCYPEVVIPDAY